MRRACTCFVGAFGVQIAALRTRLRLAEEEVGAARREALLEVQTKSLTEVEAARKKAARAFARAEALQDRCGQQVHICFPIIGYLSSALLAHTRHYY